MVSKSMPNDDRLRNQISEFRKARGWSQAELAARAGISRAAVSAIEINRLVPSVAAALALANVFECSVEELFGAAPARKQEPVWAWPPAQEPSRFWQVRIGEQTLRYPCESIPLGVIPHDGVWDSESIVSASETAPQDTLLMACCDPAANLLARKYNRLSPFRLLVLSRSSGKALDLLKQRLVHVAGVHLSGDGNHDRNALAVKEAIGPGAQILRVATWEEGLAVAPDVAAKSVQSVLKSRLTWIGREPGSGARVCLDELMGEKSRPRRVAYDHRGVADSIRSGWADVGVCHRLPCEEAGLRFLPVRSEAYDLCFRAEDAGDPRLEALIRVVRSASYRRILAELPGYSCRETGAVATV